MTVETNISLLPCVVILKFANKMVTNVKEIFAGECCMMSGVPLTVIPGFSSDYKE